MRVHDEVIAPDPGSSFRFLDRRVEAFGFNLHRHRLVELGCVVRGRITALVGGRVAVFDAPAALLIGPGLPHTWASDPGQPPPQRAYVLQFDPGLADRLAPLAEGAALPALLRRARGGLALEGATAAALATRLAGFAGARGAARLAILCDCLQAFADADPAPLAAPAADPAGRRLAAVCAWIEAHAHQGVTLAGAARVAGMHPQALARSFRRATGHSLIGWTQRVRIGRACERLQGGEAVADCALAAGFAGTAHFHRVFRRLVGCTPAAWRRRCS